MIHKGIPEVHQSFWNGLEINNLYLIYQAQAVSPAMVLKMIEDNDPMDATEDRILSYLRQHIGNMSIDELHSFVRFVKGSSVCSSVKIQVYFTFQFGAGWCIFASTCTPSLTLPRTYVSYPEFVAKFRAFLNNEYSWIMDTR